MNNDLISREALKEQIKNDYCKNHCPLPNAEHYCPSNCSARYFIKIIDNAPTVENITVFLENADESTLFDIKKELAQILTDRAEREAYEEASQEGYKKGYIDVSLGVNRTSESISKTTDNLFNKLMGGGMNV